MFRIQLMKYISAFVSWRALGLMVKAQLGWRYGTKVYLWSSKSSHQKAQSERPDHSKWLELFLQFCIVYHDPFEKKGHRTCGQ